MAAAPAASYGQAQTHPPKPGAAGSAAAPAAPAAPGHVVVRLAGTGGEPLRVIVDGVDVGATPWEGDLPPGPHQIAGRSSTGSAAPQTVDVTPGSRTAVDLIASPTGAHLQIRTSDGKGTIFVDGAARGEGAFSGDVPPGPHSVAVTREGYERFEKAMTLADNTTIAETVTLRPVAAAGSASGEVERSFEGIYGGLGFFGALGVGSQGTDLDTGCTALGASSCSTALPAGGGMSGYIGWTWYPVGFELYLIGLANQNKETAHFTGQGAPNQLPASFPPRNESFQYLRAGGGAAIRARASFQNRLIRGSIAGGIGFAFHEVWMTRKTAATDSSGATSEYAPDPIAYYSPAISLSAEGQLRMSPTLALAVGLQVWADNASIGGSNAFSAPGTTPVIGNYSQPTPAYHFATGPQVFLMPYLGLQFGP
jgi:hypothetical protein